MTSRNASPGSRETSARASASIWGIVSPGRHRASRLKYAWFHSCGVLSGSSSSSRSAPFGQCRPVGIGIDQTPQPGPLRNVKYGCGLAEPKRRGLMVHILRGLCVQFLAQGMACAESEAVTGMRIRDGSNAGHPGSPCFPSSQAISASMVARTSLPTRFLPRFVVFLRHVPSPAGLNAGGRTRSATARAAAARRLPRGVLRANPCAAAGLPLPAASRSVRTSAMSKRFLSSKDVPRKAIAIGLYCRPASHPVDRILFSFERTRECLAYPISMVCNQVRSAVTRGNHRRASQRPPHASIAPVSFAVGLSATRCAHWTAAAANAGEDRVGIIQRDPDRRFHARIGVRSCVSSCSGLRWSLSAAGDMYSHDLLANPPPFAPRFSPVRRVDSVERMQHHEFRVAQVGLLFRRAEPRCCSSQESP